MMQVRSPFFVIGSPRSGTTMLRLMLTMHPRLVVPPECGFLLWLQPQFGPWNRGDFSDESNQIEFCRAVVTSRKFQTWQLSEKEVITAVEASRPESYADACAAIYRLFASHEGKPDAIWGDKNNYYLAHIANIKELYPWARFLHIVRDGRDVACSYREVMAQSRTSPYHPDLPVAIADIARQWAGDVQSIRTQFAALPGNHALETRYEDLVSDPEQELGRICDWLGIAYAPEMLLFHEVNRTRGLEPAATIEWKLRTLDPVNSSTVGRHASLLASDELGAFIEVAEAELRQYGYLT